MVDTEKDFYEEESVEEKIEAPTENAEVDAEDVDEDSLASTKVLYIDGLDDMVVEDDEDSPSSGGNNVSYSPEERLSSLADILLSACIGKKDISRYALDKLSALRSPAVFRNENYILFSVIFNFRGKLRYISLDEEFIKLYLNRNRKILMNAKTFIDVNAYGEIDGSAELGYISGVLKHYKRLEGMEDMSEMEFETAYEKYMIEFRSLEVNRALQQSQMILNEGLTIGRHKYFGAEDSVSYFNRRVAEIEGLVNVEQGSGFVTSRELATDEKSVNKSYKIGDFGRIDTLNKVYDGIYTAMMYEVLAPPKSGKSKWTTRLAHNITVENGNNITVWAPEGGVDAWFAQYRAIHFDYLYNTGVGVAEKKYGVDQDCIVHNTFPSDEIRQLELSSKLDIGTNESYGTIDFIDKPFEIETFIDNIDNSVKRNNSVAIVIDYLQLIQSCTGKSDREAVSDAYVKLLDYIKRRNITAILPAQYTQESFNKLVETKDT
ncbi:MAG: hypothetical protein IKL53_07990, partial [Lachnospiraceae bacterium]|nr:hypothetical protein [Lachnospiraceae bacterium]